MLYSPFAFYRGAAAVTTPTIGLSVQTCADRHRNFGGFATPERSIILAIKDFDETLPGPWEWDLKRLVCIYSARCQSKRVISEPGPYVCRQLRAD